MRILFICWFYVINIYKNARHTQFQVAKFYLFCGIHIRALIVKIQEYTLVGIFLNSIYLFIYSFIQLLSTFSGRARAQVVSQRHLTAKAWVRTHASPWGICGGKSGTETGHSPSTSVFP